MPTYDYRCEDCGHKFERFQSMMDDPLKECPECKGTVKRLISAGSGIIFKGKGFYQTDYKNSGCKDKEKPCAGDKPAACRGAESCPCKE